MLRGLWTYFVAALITPVLALTALAWSWFAGRTDVIQRTGTVWSRVLLATCGARVRYADLEHLTETVPCIYMANHESNVDVWAVAAVLPRNMKFLAKKSLFRVPLMGRAMAAAGFISIDRDNRESAIRSLKRAARTIRDGHPVILFPEGTRSGDGLQPFKKGPFHLALEAGVPVVPISIVGSREVLPPRGLRVTPGPVFVRAHPPIDVRPFRPNRIDELAQEVRAVLAAGLQADRGAAGDRRAD
jgi:1-acyl-sn-glycerol-3-phosphate acyltransferase